jgi:hypothetical protein
MSTEPRIEHEYHAGRDKMTISIHGYSLSHKARDAIMKKLIAEVESSPDRLISDAKGRPENGAGKKLPGNKKASKLIEIGD